MPCPSPSPVRVAAYCRVSTDKEDQRNSLQAQEGFFRSYIQEHPGWRLVGIFADEGLSGTSIRRREQFSALLRLAQEGQLDLIVTKEVSRFARNTVDTLQVTRALKEKGVGVLFLNDGIDTRDSDGEFRLTIMASVAQEESRKISQRTRWGQLQAMKRGVVFGNNSLYGYTLSGGRLTVQPEQALVVQRIYRMFLDEGKGARAIARELTGQGVPPPLNPGGAWSAATVLRLLHNEKYCGDLVQKKFRTTDYLTHRKIPNRGAEEQVFLPGHHQAVVSRAQFQAVQEELARRASLPGEHKRFSGRHWYSGKICCGGCGKSFLLKRTRRADGREYTRFVCRGRLEGSCPMRAVPGQLLLSCVQAVWSRLVPNAAGLAAPLLEDLSRAPGQADPGRLALLRQGIRRQQARRSRAVDAFLDGLIGREELRRIAGRSHGELVELQSALARLEQAPSPDPADPRLLAWLEEELSGGEVVLSEVIQRVTVFPDCLQIQVNGVPGRFLLEGQISGRGPQSRASVTRFCFLSGQIDL